MANDKTYDRHLNIWINGKEVSNNISSIKKEMLNLTNEVNKATRGTKEYHEKAAELKRVKDIIKEHNVEVNNTGTAWTKVKGFFTGAQGIIVAGIASITAGYQSLKGIIESTDSLSDKFEKTLSGWKGGFDALSRSIATISEGGLKDLGKKIREGIEEGRRYAESLDTISEKMRGLQMKEADAKNEIIIQKNIQNTAKTLTERIEAGKKIIAIEKELETIRKDISNEAFQTEATNIANATHLTNLEVEAYARQDEAMMRNIKWGREYNKMLADRDILKNKILTLEAGQSLTKEESDEYNRLSRAIQWANDETKRFAFAAANMPGDEKMQQLVDKYVAMREALTSATENTLRVQSKLATAEESLDKNNKTLIDDVRTLDEVVADLQDSMKYDPAAFENDFVSELQAKLEDEAELAKQQAEADFELEQEINEKRIEAREQREAHEKELREADLQDTKEKEDLKLAYIQAGFQGAQIAIDSFYTNKMARLQAAMEAELSNENLTEEQKVAIKKRYAKEQQKIEVRKSIINGALAIGKSFAEYGFTPQGVIAASLAAAEAVAQTIVIKTQKYADGGFTKKGSKYTPAGIVHAGEWVASADMVSSPQYGPIIEALEQARTSGYGYAQGGGVGSVSSATPAAGLSITDPELKALIRQNIAINAKLLREGVRTNFTYSDVDNVRKGMDRLSDIENSVKM